MKRRTLHSLLLAFLFVLPVSKAQDTQLQNPALKRIYAELQQVFQKYYPGATSHLLQNKIHFEYDTRVFIVHEPLLTGEWQNPWETRGPKRGGILCDLELHNGEYNGQAALPQVFDKRYFKVLATAPYSAKRGVHLRVDLSYPPSGPKEGFLREFSAIADNFAQYME